MFLTKKLKFLYLAGALISLILGALVFLNFDYNVLCLFFASLVGALCLASLAIEEFKPSLKKVMAPFSYIALNFMVVLILAYYNLVYGSTQIFFFVFSTLVFSFAIVFSFFKENTWEDKPTFGWMIVRCVPFLFYTLFLLVDVSTCLFDYGYHSLRVIGGYFYALVCLAYFFSQTLSYKHPQASNILKFLYVILLTLSPIFFIY